MNEYSKPTDNLSRLNPVDIQKYIKTELEIKIENALDVGEENALKMRELKVKINDKNDRKIRLAIENMRKNHILVLSSTKGYWICGNLNEFLRWSGFMTSYIADISHTVKMVSNTAKLKYKEAFQIPML